MTVSATFAPAVESRAFDETKHVNFTLGMLLGIDDFNQEFAYLAGRDRRLARDAVGYGTLSGLRVAVEDDPAKGPRISVTPGSALTPTGQLVCVCPGQCAQIDDWLAAKSEDVGKRVDHSAVVFHVVLCYRDCPTDPVPFPGEPCRDEANLTVPSRLADSFRLELRLDPPDQIEENAIRAFAQWLRKVQVGGKPFATAAELQKAARDSAQPPASGPGIKFVDPPATLHLDPALIDDYLRSVFLVWTTDLRPRVHALCSGTGGCCSGHGKNEVPLDECLLLATVTAPVALASGKWHVNGAASTIAVDESKRPYVLHTRMLQELIGTSPGEQLAGGYRIVAAGIVGGTTVPLVGQPRLQFINNLPTIVFAGYDVNFTHIVKMLPMHGAPDIPLIAVASQTADGIVLNVMVAGQPLAAAALQAHSFMVEIGRV